MTHLYDMHCHLGFATDAAAAAAEGARAGISALSCKVTPAEYEALAPLLADAPDAAVALGAHPWRVADGSVGADEIGRFCELAREARFIGEIGLDFAGPRSTEESRRLQIDALERMLAALSDEGESDAGTGSTAQSAKLVSLHAVDAAGTVLDLLESSGVLKRHQVVFHWFSGTSDELNRAIAAGCYFSVGFRMLASRRGREYARQIPLDRLLLETDAPSREGQPLPADEWHALLNNALSGIAQLRGLAPGALAEQIGKTSRTLLGQ